MHEALTVAAWLFCAGSVLYATWQAKKLERMIRKRLTQNNLLEETKDGCPDCPVSARRWLRRLSRSRIDNP